MSLQTAAVTVSIVHYKSRGMLLDLLEDLFRQEGVVLDVHVVESGDDGTVGTALSKYGSQLTIHDLGKNLGYAAGNNVVINLGTEQPVLVVNPDVRMRDARTVSSLVELLGERERAGVVAPIIVDDDGLIEYADSLVDTKRALCIHTQTGLAVWPWPDKVQALSWVDGACLLFSRESLDRVGGFDERFFLLVEEVDWCVRADAAGFNCLLTSEVAVTHQRSSSFSGSTKSAYYYARNTYLLFATHRQGYSWRWAWLRRALRANTTRSARESGAWRSGLAGVRDALAGRYGPAPEDR